MRKYFKTTLAAVGTFLIAVSPAFAAGTLSCTPSSGPVSTDVVCTGNNGFTVGETCDLKVDTGSGFTTVDTQTADPGGNCFKAGSEGHWTATASGTLKVTGSTSGDTNTQSFTMTGGGGGNGMDAATLGAGFTTGFGSFGTQFGPLVLLVLGAALGLYGVKLTFAYVTNLIRARNKAEKRRVTVREPIE